MNIFFVFVVGGREGGGAGGLEVAILLGHNAIPNPTRKRQDKKQAPTN